MEPRTAGLGDLDMGLESQDEGGEKLRSSNEGIETIFNGTKNETKEYESRQMEEERSLGNVMEESRDQEDERTNTGNAVLKMAKIQTTKEDSIRLEMSPLPAGYNWVNGVLQEDEQEQSPMLGEDLATDNRKRLNEQLSELSDSEDSHVSKSKGVGTDNIIKQSAMSTQKLMDENFFETHKYRYRFRPAGHNLVMEQIDNRWRMIKREQLGLSEDALVTEGDEYSDDEAELEWNVRSRNHEWRDAESTEEEEYNMLIWRRGLGEEFEGSMIERPMPVLIK